MGHGIAQVCLSEAVWLGADPLKVAAMAGYQVVAFEKEKKFYDKV